MLTFRQPEISDVNEIKLLEIECMEKLHGRLGVEFPIFDEEHNDEANLLSIIEAKCGCVILCEDEEINGHTSIVGAIIAMDSDLKSFEDEDHCVLKMLNIFVRQDQRRQGIGHRLLEQLEAWAKEKHYEEISFEMYLPNEEMKTIFEHFHYSSIVETRKKIIDTERYENRKQMEESERIETIEKQLEEDRKRGNLYVP